MAQKLQTSLKELEIEARRVLVRINLDVPLKNGKITDATLLESAMSTIDYLIDNGARVVIAGHLGKATGKVDPKYSLEPIAAYLASKQHIGEIFLTDSCVGDGARSVIAGLREGQVCLLENLAFHAGEFENSEKLAKQLASFCDIYVNEAFSLNNRVLSSTNCILKHARVKTIGLSFSKEFNSVRQFLNKPERPVVAIIGASTITENLELFEHILPSLDSVIIGGAMANTFAAATGGEIGKSKFDKTKLPLARDIIDRCGRRNIKLLLPVDYKCTDGETECVHTAGAIPAEKTSIDVGPKTLEKYKQVIRKAGTILWKGNLGISPKEKESSQIIAKSISGSSAFSLAIGADTAKTIRSIGLDKGFDHVSDGGNPTIRMLEGKSLVTINAMNTWQIT